MTAAAVGTAIGPIMQYAFVVPDCEQAALQWSQHMGVGPFFLMQNIGFNTLYYRGRPSRMQMSVAMAYSNGVQIEFVQVLDDRPSMYREFLATSPAGGQQHVGVLSTDLEADIGRLGGESQRIQWGETAAGMRFAYMHTGAGPGSVVELIEANETVLAAFAKMRRAAEQWDGQRPLRGKRVQARQS